MAVFSPPKLTLRQMRRAADKGRGLSCQQVADQVAILLGEEARTGESIANIERRGNSDYYILRALAAVYNQPLEEVATAARPTGNK